MQPYLLTVELQGAPSAPKGNVMACMALSLNTPLYPLALVHRPKGALLVSEFPLL